MGTFLKKLFTKKEKKSYQAVFEKIFEVKSWRRTTTMDESALEKLRWLPAGGANKVGSHGILEEKYNIVSN